jgi:tetratricopeptide (TPR) repeat protein
MASKIFISYRRDDSPGTAGRLYDRLAQSFGEANLFIDVDKIPAGVNFVKHLNEQVANCNIFLCTIGPNWLSAKNDDGHRRLDQPGDYVRIEVAAALKRDIPVIPVLIDGACVPKARELPDDIASLAERQAVEVDNSQFGRDAYSLEQKIRGILKEQRSAPIRAAFAAGAVVVALFVFGLNGIYQLSREPRSAEPKPPELVPEKAPALVTDCDRLAADPIDPERPRSVPGVTKPINVAAALQACREAVIKYPDVGRFSLSLGRALFWAEDYPASLKQFERAAGLGNTAAMNAIANMYLNGYGMPQNYGEARRWYEKSAATGNSPIAMNNLGAFYENGRGVSQDYAEAKRWYEKAVETAGSPVGMTNIARLYENGRGVQQDYAEAKRWYEKAAAQGNLNAMVHLGDMYRDGRGLSKSVADARTWYERAVTAGSTDARDRIAALPSQ